MKDLDVNEWFLEKKYDYHDRKLNKYSKIYYSSETPEIKSLRAYGKMEIHIEKLKELQRKLEHSNNDELNDWEIELRKKMKAEYYGLDK